MLYGFLNLNGVSFNPLSDIPKLDGKVILITGGNAGLGKQSIIELSKHNPAHIYLCARDKTKADAAKQELRCEVPDAPITYLQCDLTDLKSVQATAKEFNSMEKRLDILFLNAGIMATPAGTTKQGYEIQFGTNHMGHALLTKLLMSMLLKTAETGADVRVVALSSIGHALAPWCGIYFPALKTPTGGMFTVGRYGQSKLADILFTMELARRYPQITAVSVHPGVVNTPLYASMGKWYGIGYVLEMSKRMMFTTVEQGVKNQLWAATASKDQIESGRYYTPVGLSGQGSRMSSDAGLAKELWDWTENELVAYKVAAPEL